MSAHGQACPRFENVRAWTSLSTYQTHDREFGAGCTSHDVDVIMSRGGAGLIKAHILASFLSPPRKTHIPYPIG